MFFLYDIIGCILMLALEDAAWLLCMSRGDNVTLNVDLVTKFYAYTGVLDNI